MGIPMNLEHENLKLLLEDAEQLIEASSTRNEIKTSLRFNKKINTNKSSCPEIEPHNKPNLRLIPSNLKTLLSFPDKFCKCHKIRLTVNGIFIHLNIKKNLINSLKSNLPPITNSPSRIS